MQRKILLGIILVTLGCNIWYDNCPAQTSTESGLNIIISKNVELMGILINLTDTWDRQPDDFPPAVETRNRFLPFKNHPAVKSTQTLLNGGWGRVDFCSLGIYLSEFPEARPMVDTADSNMARFLAPGVLRYVEAVRDFYIQSDFDSFWEEKRPFYDTVRSIIEARVGSARIAYYLELVYGTAMDYYYLVPSPQMPCLSLHVERMMDGRQEAFCIFGPCAAKKDEDYFIAKLSLVADVIFREFSYSFVEPLLKKHETLVAEYSDLYDIAKADMVEKGYDTWPKVFKENLNHAMQARLAGKLYGRAFYLKKLESAAQSGFVMAPTMADIVDTYCMNRDKYPIFEDYLPLLFATLSERYADSLKTEGNRR
jgi:Domain of unknown function (DUF4932)